jgi:hypothetical protein
MPLKENTKDNANKMYNFFIKMNLDTYDGYGFIKLLINLLF